MMRKGELSEYPVAWVLREASREALTGGIELHVGEQVTSVHVSNGDVYLVIGDGEDPGVVIDDSLDDDAYAAAVRAADTELRDRAVRSLGALLDRDDGWYFFHPLNHHPLKGEWAWNTADLLADAEHHRVEHHGVAPHSAGPPSAAAAAAAEAEGDAGEHDGAHGPGDEPEVESVPSEAATDPPNPPAERGEEPEGGATVTPITAGLAGARLADGPFAHPPPASAPGSETWAVPPAAPPSWIEGDDVSISPHPPRGIAPDQWAVLVAMSSSVTFEDLAAQLGWTLERTRQTLDAMVTAGVVRPSTAE